MYIFCPHCAAKLLEGAPFCPGCGTKIGEGAPQAPSVPPPTIIYTTAPPEHRLPGRTLLKVMGILYIVFGGLGLLWTIGMMGAVDILSGIGGIFGAPRGVIQDLQNLAIYGFIASIWYVIVGVVSIQNCNKAAVSMAIVAFIELIHAVIISIGSFNIFYMIAMVAFPVLLIVGINMNVKALTPIPSGNGSRNMRSVFRRYKNVANETQPQRASYPAPATPPPQGSPYDVAEKINAQLHANQAVADETQPQRASYSAPDTPPPKASPSQPKANLCGCQEPERKTGGWCGKCRRMI